MTSVRERADLRPHPQQTERGRKLSQSLLTFSMSSKSLTTTEFQTPCNESAQGFQPTKPSRIFASLRLLGTLWRPIDLDNALRTRTHEPKAVFQFWRLEEHALYIFSWAWGGTLQAFAIEQTALTFVFLLLHRSPLLPYGSPSSCLCLFDLPRPTVGPYLPHRGQPSRR